MSACVFFNLHLRRSPLKQTTLRAHFCSHCVFFLYSRVSFSLSAETSHSNPDKASSIFIRSINWTLSSFWTCWVSPKGTSSYKQMHLFLLKPLCCGEKLFCASDTPCALHCFSYFFQAVKLMQEAGGSVEFGIIILWDDLPGQLHGDVRIWTILCWGSLKRWKK